LNRHLAAIAGFAILTCTSAATAQDLLYTLERSATLPSTNTGWDYAKMEPGTSRLHIARDVDGNVVFDVDANRAIATVENSKGANGPLLIPRHDIGYVAMTDGSLLRFRLKSLKPIARLALAEDGGLNSAVYDPGTDRIHAIVGTRPQQSTWFTLDAATGALRGKTVFPFRKMDDPANDGKGRLFAPVRYDNIILALDSRTLAETGRWQVPCNVSKVRFQANTNLVLAACLGDAPRFLALDAATGAVVASLPIGRGIDGFAVDEMRGRIITSNGADGTLSVIGQNGRDFRPLGTVSTRPGARMMTIDERTGKLLVVTADYTLPPPAADGTPATKIYHPNSFTVLTYAPR
jgi:hypothetical protein